MRDVLLDRVQGGLHEVLKVLRVGMYFSANSNQVMLGLRQLRLDLMKSLVLGGETCTSLLKPAVEFLTLLLQLDDT